MSGFRPDRAKSSSARCSPYIDDASLPSLLPTQHAASDVPNSWGGVQFSGVYVFFFAAAALALAAFFWLLRIMTTPRKEPTTAEARRMRMTGIRTAQTRGGKKFWRGWSESTKGWEGGRCVSYALELSSFKEGGGGI